MTATLRIGRRAMLALHRWPHEPLVDRRTGQPVVANLHPALVGKGTRLHAAELGSTHTLCGKPVRERLRNQEREITSPSVCAHCARMTHRDYE